MRFMVIVKASEETEAGQLPTEAELTEMGRFNEELVKAGVMLAGEGLHPSSKGARVYFSGDKRTVIDGPFTETKELIAGFWLIEVKSLRGGGRVGQAGAEPDRRGVRDRDPAGLHRGLRQRLGGAEAARARAARAGRRPRQGRLTRG